MSRLRQAMRFAGAILTVAVTSATSGAGETDPPRHLVYLHGRIVQEQQSPRPHHPRFGYYELEQIKDALRARGFEVEAEIRPKTATVSESADQVVERVRRLLVSGALPEHITVVGASMGGEIALVASARLQNPDVRYCILGGCLSESTRRLPKEEGKGPSGRILSIREASDDVTGPCPTFTGKAGRPGLRAREIVLHTGLSHGFLYTPIKEWLDPVVEWVNGR
jgi:dienelactone hydrolase